MEHEHQMGMWHYVGIRRDNGQHEWVRFCNLIDTCEFEEYRNEPLTQPASGR